MKSFLFAILFIIHSLRIQAQFNVLYGEIDSLQYCTSICFDKDGSLYPDLSINSGLLGLHEYSLIQLFQHNSFEFKRVSQAYNCSFDSFNEIHFQTLQDSIRNKKTALLKKKSADKSLCFLIHGFRKSFRDTLHDWSSQRDFAEIRRAISNSRTYYVDVFWDAQYGCCFSSNAKQNRKLFHVFETAQQNAVLTGQGLQKILAAFNDKTIHIITHSLGAKVACNAVMGDRVKNQDLNLVLVAPAIGKKELIYTADKISSETNCELGILYNRKDFVLRKKDPILFLFGPGTSKYGNTSLGCNRWKSATKAEKEINAKKSNVRVKTVNAISVGKCHHVRCYFNNEDVIRVFK